MTTNDLKQIRDIVKEEAFSSEKRLEEKIEHFSTDIGNFMHKNIIPLFDEKADKSDIERLERNMDRIERKLDQYSDQTLDHKHRLTAIEATPTIAHELKRTHKK